MQLTRQVNDGQGHTFEGGQQTFGSRLGAGPARVFRVESAQSQVASGQALADGVFQERQDAQTDGQQADQACEPASLCR